MWSGVKRQSDAKQTARVRFNNLLRRIRIIVFDAKIGAAGICEAACESQCGNAAHRSWAVYERELSRLFLGAWFGIDAVS